MSGDVRSKKSTIDELMSKLRQERDELRLQMHLASMEARDEYDRLSEKYDQMTDHFAPVQDVVEETASNVYSAFGLLGRRTLFRIQPTQKNHERKVVRGSAFRSSGSVRGKGGLWSVQVNGSREIMASASST